MKVPSNPSTPYLPANHVRVWLVGFSLHIQIPDQHTVVLPLNKINSEGVNLGYEIFLDLLRKQEQGIGTIGTPSSPIQHELNRALREFNKSPSKAKPRIDASEDQRERARAALRKIGIL